MTVENSNLSRTINIIENGTYNVSEYTSAVVSTASPESPYYIEKINNNGTLENSANTINLTNIITVGPAALYAAYAGNTKISGTVDMSSIQHIDGDYACAYMFYGTGPNQLPFPNITGVDLRNLKSINGSNALANFCQGSDYYPRTTLTSINLDSLESITGYNALISAFAYNTGITSVSLPNLKTINGGEAVYNMFKGCTELLSFNAPNLEVIEGNSCFNGFLSGCTKLTTANFHNLKRIGDTSTNGVFYYVFTGSNNLTSLDLSSLEEVGRNGMASFCSYCKLTRVDFPSLKLIGENGLANSFSSVSRGNDTIQSMWFYALDTDSFGTYTNQFNYMLSGKSTATTVHFPMRIQSTIGSWSDVTNGFAGTNTTVLFDIVTTATGADTNAYSRIQKESTATATAWTFDGDLYYTSGTSEPTVGDTIYSDAECTTAVTTVASIS